MIEDITPQEALSYISLYVGVALKRNDNPQDRAALEKRFDILWDAINSKKLGLSTLENLKLPDEEDVHCYSPSCCDQRVIDGHNQALSLPEVIRAFELAQLYLNLRPCKPKD